VRSAFQLYLNSKLSSQVQVTSLLGHQLPVFISQHVNSIFYSGKTYIWGRCGVSDTGSKGVSVNTTSAPSATCLCRLAQPPARNRQSMYSCFAQKWCGLLSFWALSWLRARML